MSFIESLLVANTIALGAVAIGSMKAQLAAKVAGTINVAGHTPIDRASCPIIGRRTLAVAVLLVISVRNVTAITMRNTSTVVGRPWRMLS
mmetsp:Transcript_14610/g.19692  ORF Transcript_14610/g.19692 Transcript_14610/m.19692 type:complete len:90 (+) Transcript_14610:339-608(+)